MGSPAFLLINAELNENFAKLNQPKSFIIHYCILPLSVAEWRHLSHGARL